MIKQNIKEEGKKIEGKNEINRKREKNKDEIKKKKVEKNI